MILEGTTFLFALAALASYAHATSNSPLFQVNLNVFSQSAAAKANSNEPGSIATRTFWILKEPGASITLGPCPDNTCFRFELAGIETLESSLVQKILVSGDGFRDVLNAEWVSKSAIGETNVETLNKIMADASPVMLAGKGANFITRFGAIRTRIVNISGTNILADLNPTGVNTGGVLESVGLSLEVGSFVEIHSRNAFIRLTVLDTRTDSLKIRLDVNQPAPLRIPLA